MTAPRPPAPGRVPRGVSPGRAADVLLALAAGLAAVGVALVVWRPAPRVPSMPPVPVAPAAVAGAPIAPLLGGAALQERVVQSNLFAATRTPPRARYRPADAEGAFDAASLEPRPDAADGRAAMTSTADGALLGERADGGPQFYGTIIGPDGPRALLRLDTRAPGAQLYPAGARAAGWRVVRVEPERVVLSGAGGQVTLRLPKPGTRPAPDSAARVTSDSLGR